MEFGIFGILRLLPRWISSSCPLSPIFPRKQGYRSSTYLSSLIISDINGPLFKYEALETNRGGRFLRFEDSMVSTCLTWNCWKGDWKLDRSSITLLKNWCTPIKHLVKEALCSPTDWLKLRRHLEIWYYYCIVLHQENEYHRVIKEKIHRLSEISHSQIAMYFTIRINLTEQAISIRHAQTWERKHHVCGKQSKRFPFIVIPFFCLSLLTFIQPSVKKKRSDPKRKYHVPSLLPDKRQSGKLQK